MNQLGVIPDAAVLIRNGIIEEVGPARRLENLARARNAREIDALGRVVMPSFVDPDGVLVSPKSAGGLPQLSRRVLDAGAAGFVSQCVRSGVLSIGAHTRAASALKDTVKILRVHRALAARPMRIRSIFSPRSTSAEDLISKWLPAIERRKLAGIVEFSADAEQGGFTTGQIKLAALAAADRGFSIRIRCTGPADPELHALALQAGTVVWIGFPQAVSAGAAVQFGGVYALPCSSVLDGPSAHAAAVRRAIGEGIPIALASSSPATGMRCTNPQYSLCLAASNFGLSCEEAIIAATYNAACALRMSHVTGSVEPGKAADLLVMDIPDYRELTQRVGHNDVLAVMRAGHFVYQRAGLKLPPHEKANPPIS